MKFIDALRTYDLIVENGPLGTRLQYDYKFELGSNMETFDLIEHIEGRKALNELYRGDIEVAQKTRTPIIINAATFRASKNHLRARNLDKPEDVKRINLACINLIKEIQASYANSGIPIFIGAPVGSMNNAYCADLAPSVEEAQAYHQQQMNIFKEAQVDFVNAVTLPSLSEALGIALAAQESDLDYTIGFVLNERGTLLDGTPLHEAIREINKNTSKKPLGYLITCTHASNIAKLADAHDEYKCIIGVQTNGSNLSLKELNAVGKPLADPPEQFAGDLMRLREQFNLKIVGGCCGTSRLHLQAIIEAAYPKTELNLEPPLNIRLNCVL